MKKFILLFLLVIFASGWSPLETIPAIKNLKSDITTQLNELFDREISVESVSGNLVNQIELNNVAIAKEKKLSDGSIIKAKRIVISYNPFKLAASRGNITGAISKIEIIEPDILVERSIHDEWNMAGLVPRSKPLEGGEKPKPLMFSGKVVIKGGYGLYVDHMGWGEDLKGKAFTSKIKDLNCEIKLSGNKIDLSGTATSAIGSSVAFTNTTGTLNVKTGRYRFVVIVKNADMEKWGYYTLNVPHFKPISGISDMKMTMTNPPPRKKGLPIFFDGQFYIRNGRARIFDRSFDNLNGFVSVHDEEVVFRNLTGYRDKVPVTANGRLYDFTVANYDITLDIPNARFRDISRAFPEIANIDFSGRASANIHIGGNYGHPIFKGFAIADGDLFKQSLTGRFDFYAEGPVLHISSDNISAYGGRLYAKSIFDFTPSIPFLDVNISGEGLTPGKIVPVIPGKNEATLLASIKGSLQKLTIKSALSLAGSGEISAFGTIEADRLDMSLSCADLKIAYDQFRGKLGSFTGKIYGDLRNPGKDLALEGKARFSDSIMAMQPISEATAAFKYKNDQLDISGLTLWSGNSRVSVTGRTGLNCKTDLMIEATSAEASDLKVLDAFLPKELTPVTGKLDLSLSASGEIANLKKIDPASFSVYGNCRLSDGSISHENLREANLNISWENSRLTLKDSRIRTRSTDVLVNGNIETAGKIDMNISGTLELANLRPVTLKYGRLSGSSRIMCDLTGETKKPDVAIEFDGDDLRYNEIIIDHASGKVMYDGKNLSFEKPLTINQADDEYTISGNISIAEKPELKLRLDVLKGDLNTAVELIDKINAEIGTKQIFSVSEKQNTIVLYPSKFQFPGPGTKLIYNSDEDKTIIEDMKNAESYVSSYGKTIKEKTGRNAKGKFSGYVDIEGGLDNLSGALDFKVSSGTWESYTFDEIGVKAGLENGTFEVSAAYIKKGNGILATRGTFNPLSSASLEIRAVNMPIDFLSLFIGRGKTFEGRFNMSAFLFGPVSSLVGNASIEAHKVNIGGVALDSIISEASFRKNTIFFNRTELVTGSKKAVISGKLPLDRSDIDLGITMEGESLGLLTIASSDISWIKGTGQGFVQITGDLGHPKFNGHLSINDASVYLKPVESNLQSMNAEIKISNNVISTEGLAAKWIGKWTQNNANKIKLYGSVDFNNLFSKERSLDLDLRLSDGDFIVDIPNFYKGDLEFKGFSLVGPLWLGSDNPKAPKLSGTFNLSNGVIILPDMSKKNDLPPMALNLTLNILKNSYVSAGDMNNLISTDLSNLDLNLELEGQNITISGLLDAPKIFGKTTFGRGTISILNREFSLMSEDRQKEVFPSDLEKVKENTADFQGRSLPNLTLAAEITVKSTDKTAATAQSKNPIYVTTNVLVISRITGVPFSTVKEEGLNLAFYAFIEDTTKQPSEFTPTTYTEEDIKVLLLPDFIKSSLGISDKGVGGVDASDVLADYLNSRLNTYLLRNVERNLAKSLELESLTLEYNFGKDLKNMMPTNRAPVEINPQEAPETMYGIGAVKSFFGRLYIDVNYSQAVEQQAIVNNAYMNYQITYKLNPVLSVVYYREPFNFIEQESDYYKVTLKAGYEL
jgi:TamB, inner membrane protein subunit of TAM complex